MNILQHLLGIGNSKPQPKERAAAPADITYNPDPNTNIPNSSHDLDLIKFLTGLAQSLPMQGGAQGYPMAPDGVPPAQPQGGPAQPLGGMLLQQLQPTNPYFMTQNNRPADTIQYGNDPWLQGGRR